MVSIQLNENRHNLLIGVIMVILAVLFLLYMGSSMVRSTKAFWEESNIETFWQFRSDKTGLAHFSHILFRLHEAGRNKYITYNI